MAVLTVQAILDELPAYLDAEGSDHYRWDQDFKHWINGTIDWITAIAGEQMGRRKFGEKVLSELLATKIFQTSTYGRIHLNDAALTFPIGPIWDVVGMIAEPQLIQPNPVLTPGTAEASFFRGDLAFKAPGVSCKRITLEELAETKRNTFAAGSGFFTDPTMTNYYFCMMGTMSATSGYNTVGWEYEIGPTNLTSKKYVAISYLRVPRKVTVQADSLDFPVSMKMLFVFKCLNLGGIKVGDATTLEQESEKLTAQLTAALAV